jgi:hypothetical protein
LVHSAAFRSPSIMRIGQFQHDVGDPGLGPRIGWQVRRPVPRWARRCERGFRGGLSG